MESNLVKILEGLKLSQEFDVILQGSLSEDDIEPEHYFTYWCWDNARGEIYDNQHNKNDIGYQIEAYSTDRTFLLEMVNEAIKELEKNDFIIDNDVTDSVSSDKFHTAKTFDIYFIKKKEV